MQMEITLPAPNSRVEQTPKMAVSQILGLSARDLY